MNNIPQHVAIIMDGNGRWAQSKSMPRTQGHRAGAKNLVRIMEEFIRNGVKFVTLFAFSTENWNRPSNEINELILLLKEALSQEISTLNDKNIRLQHIGRLDKLDSDTRRLVDHCIVETKTNNGLILTVAFDYGGRAEIVDAIKSIIKDQIHHDNIDEKLVEKYLYTVDLPDPDLIIRTAGEMRVSNFLLWQSAYTEYYSTATLWPDFDEKEVKIALKEYSLRFRKYGGFS
jgi:undecaprenyl diphosphate synthase